MAMTQKYCRKSPKQLTVFSIYGICFLVTQLGCAVTDSFAGMLLSRLFLGVGGCKFT